MILVVGSTGALGSEICLRLLTAGQAVRGLVRSTSTPEKVAQLNAMGVQTVLGDLREPSSLRAACSRVEAVVITASTLLSIQPGNSFPVNEHQDPLGLVHSAKFAGVRRFVLVSFLPGMEASPLTTVTLDFEGALQVGGMDYTILRPGLFMETWLNPALGFDYANARATIYGEGHAANCYISRGDVAQYAVESLANPAARNATFEISLATSYSLLEVVRVFEKISGKSFELQFVPVAVLAAQHAAATDPLQISCTSFIHRMAQGTQLDCSRALQAFSIPLISLEDYASRVMGKNL